MLENFEHILSSITCPNVDGHLTSGTIVMSFTDDDAFQEASYEWKTHPELVAITSHEGCNADHEHGAWSCVSYPSIQSLNEI